MEKFLKILTLSVLVLGIQVIKCDEIGDIHPVTTTKLTDTLASGRLENIGQKFTLQLLKSLQDKNIGHTNGIPVSDQKNLIFSPFNIIDALTLLLLGAGGETFKELFKTLHYGDVFRGSKDITAKNQEILHTAIHGAIRTLKNYRNTTIEISNAIYPEESFKIDPTFIKKAFKYYEAQVKTLNYKSQADAGVKIINSEVSKNTKGLIKDLLPRGSLDSNTKLVMVNAIYFKSDWDDRFDTKLTTLQAFTRDDGIVENVKMMFGHKNARYGSTKMKMIGDLPTSVPDQEIQVLRMQYANPNLAMFFVLPEKNGLSNLIKVLSSESLSSLMKMVENTLVDITLPVFETRYDVALSETLKNLGLRNIFDSTADFTGLTGSITPITDKLYVSEIFHKAVIEVN
ncbi:unnamed protein product [Gordionus sp. m RMFG-2023]|uniref:leukocyte elastase inhibitor-like n=1 Tax=Gordionus sp. m RMFG-2023 TaxID=3053472 RepID=UPI0030E3839F